LPIWCLQAPFLFACLRQLTWIRPVSCFFSVRMRIFLFPSASARPKFNSDLTTIPDEVGLGFQPSLSPAQCEYRRLLLSLGSPKFQFREPLRWLLFHPGHGTGLITHVDSIPHLRLLLRSAEAWPCLRRGLLLFFKHSLQGRGFLLFLIVPSLSRLMGDL